MGRLALATTLAGMVAACGLSVVGQGVSPDGADGGDASSGDASGGETSLADAADGGGPDGSACAADLAVDPGNCGACGHDCLGGACAAGQCQPMVLVSGVPGVRGVAVDVTQLYWTSPSAKAVSASLLDGGSRGVLVGDAGAAAFVARAGNEVYWTVYEAGSGAVYAHTLPSGPTRTVATNQDYPSGITVIGTTPFWCLQYTDSMAKSLPDGGAAVVTAGGLDFPEGLTHDTTKIYVAAPGNEIFSVGLDGGAPTTLATGYAASQPAGIAEDGDTLYITMKQAGTVVSMKKTGGALTTLATGQSSPTGIAIDAAAIYWANAGAGTIMRLAR